MELIILNKRTRIAQIINEFLWGLWIWKESFRFATSSLHEYSVIARFSVFSSRYILTTLGSTCKRLSRYIEDMSDSMTHRISIFTISLSDFLYGRYARMFDILWWVWFTEVSEYCSPDDSMDTSCSTSIATCCESTLHASWSIKCHSSNNMSNSMTVVLNHYWSTRTRQEIHKILGRSTIQNDSCCFFDTIPVRHSSSSTLTITVHERTRRSERKMGSLRSFPE